MRRTMRMGKTPYTSLKPKKSVAAKGAVAKESAIAAARATIAMVAAIAKLPDAALADMLLADDLADWEAVLPYLSVDRLARVRVIAREEHEKMIEWVYDYALEAESGY